MKKYSLLIAWIFLFLLLYIADIYFHFPSHYIFTVLFLSGIFVWGIGVFLLDVHIRRKENFILNKVENRKEYMKERKDELITTLTNLPFPVVLVSKDKELVIYNEEMVKLSNVQSSDVTFDSLQSAIQSFMTESMLIGKQIHKVLAYENVELEATCVPIGQTEDRSFLFIFQDLSVALEGERNQKQFIADASHELKTPIAIIKGMVEILNREGFDDEVTRKDFLHEIEMETNRLEGIVIDLVELSKLSSGKPLLHRSKVDMKELIEECKVSVHEFLENKNLDMVLELEENMMFFCDPKNMTTVILNLMTNAIKYSTHGTIHVFSRILEHEFIFEIKDYGVGIPEEDLRKIFYRFYRVDDARTSAQGTGLGLAITKSIVEAHNGNIFVRSEEGKGSTFTVVIKDY